MIHVVCVHGALFVCCLGGVCFMFERVNDCKG